MKKWLCVILALVLVVSLAGCGASGSTSSGSGSKAKAKKTYDPEDLIGTWETTVSVPTEDLISYLEGITEEIKIRMLLTFDGEEVTLKMDADSLVENEERLEKAMMDYLYEQGEEEGYSRQELEDMAQEEMGCSVQEYVEGVLEEQLTALAEDMEESFVVAYTVEDKTITLEDYTDFFFTASFYVQGKKLVLEELLEGEADGVMWKFPLTLKQVSD